MEREYRSPMRGDALDLAFAAAENAWELDKKLAARAIDPSEGQGALRAALG